MVGTRLANHPDCATLTPVRVVGRSVPRKEGLAKARGAARYIDDLRLPGMLYGRTIRTTVARGEVAAVHVVFDRAGFTVVDHRDIPGRNVVALIQDDQPFLVEREIRHAEEAVLLLAHEDAAPRTRPRADCRGACRSMAGETDRGTWTSVWTDA